MFWATFLRPWTTRSKRSYSIALGTLGRLNSAANASLMRCSRANHERIEHWRRRQALRRTFARRPDLLQQIELDEEEQQLIAAWREQGLEEAP